MYTLIRIALPIICAGLIVLFFAGLPNLKHCALPGIIPAERRFTRKDAAPLLAITLIYAIFAFTGLGNRQSPESFAPMADNSAVITLPEGALPSGIMLFSGVGSGTYEIEYSEDGVNYTHAASFEQGYNSVLKWNSVPIETELVPRYVRVSSTGGNAYLGEFTLLDGDGVPISVSGCTAPELCDETALTPVKQTYFDEIYHARTAWEHLNNVYPYEVSHPPLGKEIMSLGIAIFGMTPFGWRFCGTLFGVLMLPVMYLFLKRLFGGKAIPAAGTIIFAADFMHYAQTRIATIDTYALFFILLMYYFMYIWLSEKKHWALALSGLFFGIGAASKWTCIYAGAGLAVLWAAHWFNEFAPVIKTRRRAKAALSSAWDSPEPELSNLEAIENAPLPLAAFFKNCLFCVVFFVLIPCVIYYFAYIPYGAARGITPLSKEYLSIVLENQRFMFTYHAGVHSEHPYSSRWYQWVLNIRPILYYLEYFDNGSRSSISSFLNPALCWGGFLSLFVLGYESIARRDKKAAFILIGYLAQLLPWVFITRITFEYHYFACSAFLVLSLCYVFSILRQNSRRWRALTFGYAALCAALFLLFYPALSGKPIDNTWGHALLGWLPTWPI